MAGLGAAAGSGMQGLAAANLGGHVPPVDPNTFEVCLQEAGTGAGKEGARGQQTRIQLDPVARHFAMQNETGGGTTSEPHEVGVPVQSEGPGVAGPVAATEGLPAVLETLAVPEEVVAHAVSVDVVDPGSVTVVPSGVLALEVHTLLHFIYYYGQTTESAVQGSRQTAKEAPGADYVHTDATRTRLPQAEHHGVPVEPGVLQPCTQLQW
eukprot:CAMPEP_0201281760 /NCGR_PEP_ID=MMETSP1317-20130820/3979_1 /ASSEMBLY_ACC=CAM_ASM_000770 /TAXON_ID=187299 /ORGANISM="Undescribed Undescribed, Strain Undescribed" /LENGTH=208 /DNA_ID=CAMNT_0047592539 /DNA_START=9 /DNA_END=632 /DNA_ORIENTATION=-